MSFAKFAMSLAALCAGAIYTASTVASAQERIIALKGGDTIVINHVWSVRKCQSIVTAAPTAELLDGPPFLKLWVEPAMVIPSRLGCTEPVPGGKLMVTAGTVTEKAEIEIKLRTIYQTSEGERQVGRSYKISMFPGEARPDVKAEPSQSWSSFLAKSGTSGDNKAASRNPAGSSDGKSRSARKILKKHKLIRVASADQAIPKGLSREALYTSCRQRVYKKYSWDGHDGKRYMERQIWIGMTDACVAHGGQVP